MFKRKEKRMELTDYLMAFGAQLKPLFNLTNKKIEPSSKTPFSNRFSESEIPPKTKNKWLAMGAQLKPIFYFAKNKTSSNESDAKLYSKKKEGLGIKDYLMAIAARTIFLCELFLCG